MTELLTAAQMRAIEQAAIASGKVTGLELMERAGQGVVQAIFEEWPDLKAGSFRAVVLCGPGNNGGDGFVVARLLKEWGWEVEVYLYGDPDKMPPDARVNFDRWAAMGEVGPLSEESDSFTTRDVERIYECDVVVDALFGIGLTRPAPFFEQVSYVLHKCFHDALWWWGGQTTPRIVAIDQPSGLCANSGREITDAEGNSLGEPYAAYLTVTFHRPKLGHYLADGPRFCTKLAVVDIGLPASQYEGVRPRRGNDFGTFLTRSPAQDFEVFQNLRRADGGHKFSHGHALVLAGGSGKGGAARLAARAALRMGAGLVTVVCPGAAMAENAARLDAVMLHATDAPGEFRALLADERITALCIGPGFGIGQRCREFVAEAVQSGRPVVLDADALTSFVDAPEELFRLIRTTDRNKRHRLDEAQVAQAWPDRDPKAIIKSLGAPQTRVVLTPHGGEFARLFPDIAAKLDAPATKGPAYSKVDATREAAARAGCVVLFKGADTVIASPDGTCAINAAAYDRAAPWLATAGSGDVLAGFITGLLARGFAPQQAAETGAWLHVECARSFGPGLIAEDLPEELPKVLRALGV